MTLRYKTRNDKQFRFKSSKGIQHSLSIDIFSSALKRTHKIIDQIDSFEVNIAEVLGMRNLSAFLGELYVASFAKESKGFLLKNPHQDGYPDLLIMDDKGQKTLDEIKSNNGMKEKKPFSPFANGGLEVKATCGSVPTPAQCGKKGLEKPDIGDQRITFVKGYDWKAHHRETNNLIGLFWDFINNKPRIVAVFFCADLDERDWGKIVKPKDGGGRTTSVSIMSRDGVRKMFDNWVLVIDDHRYKKFLNNYNGLELL